MGLTIEEAVKAATLGGAMALHRDEATTDRAGLTRLPLGRIRVGARADLHVLEAPSITHLAYRPGVPLTGAVWQAGRRVV